MPDKLQLSPTQKCPKHFLLEDLISKDGSLCFLSCSPGEIQDMNRKKVEERKE